MEVLLEKIIANSKYQPRDYQKRIVINTVKGFLESGYKSILIESATGSGKSGIMLMVCKMLQELLNVKIGWVAHRKFLLKQAATENIDKQITSDIQFISMFDKNPDCGKIDLLCIDEAQHDAASSCMHLHSLLQPKYILGASAFPFRTDRVKLCFDKKITDSGIQELIKLGYLSPYQHFTITDVWSPENVVKYYLKEIKRWGKTIMYFHTVIECLTASQLLDAVGVKNEVITGHSKEGVQLHRFKNSTTCNVVINCMKLTEGLDIPQLNTVFVRPACKSVTIQCAGRVFRKHDKIPFKNVVQCNRTKWPFLRTAMPMKQHLWQYDRWFSLTPNENAEYAKNKMISAIAQISVKLPALLTNKKTNRRRTIMPSDI